MKFTTNHSVTRIAVAAAILGFASQAFAAPPQNVPEAGSTLGLLALSVIGLGLARNIVKKFKK